MNKWTYWLAQQTPRTLIVKAFQYTAALLAMVLIGIPMWLMDKVDSWRQGR